MLITVSTAYIGELGTGHFLRYKRKSAVSVNSNYCKIALPFLFTIV